MDNAGSKRSIIILGILLLAIIMPACAEDISGNVPVTFSEKIIDTITVTPIEKAVDTITKPSETVTTIITTEPVISSETPVDEQLEGRRSVNYLKKRWLLTNFTRTENSSYFWIYNEKAPDIYLSELILQNYDTNETIPYLYSQKTTIDGGSTDSLWNLWGLLNPDDKLCQNETLQIIYEGHISNISVSYRDNTITHMEAI